MTEYIGVVLEETANISLVEVCRLHQWPEDKIVSLLEHGLLQEITTPTTATLNLTMIRRLQRAYRLHVDLSLPADGVVLVMELLDTLDKLRAEIELLKRT